MYLYVYMYEFVYIWRGKVGTETSDKTWLPGKAGVWEQMTYTLSLP